MRFLGDQSKDQRGSFSYLILLQTVRYVSERRAMVVGTDTAVAAEPSVGFWVPEALVDGYFFFGERILKSHCFLLVPWRQMWMQRAFCYVEEES